MSLNNYIVNTMDDVTVLNTVFDDTIPQTPFNVLQNIGSVDPSIIILDQTEPGGNKEATIVIEDDKETTNVKNTSRVTKIKDDPDKRENLPIKFEQVIIDDLNEEDLVNYNPFSNKEGTKNGRSSPVVYEVKVKKEIVDSDCELDMSNDYADNQQQVKARRDSFQCSICFKKYKNLKSFEKHERQHVNKQKIDKELELDLSSNLCIEIIDCLSPKNDIFTCTCKKDYILRSPLISCLKSHHFEDNGELNPEVKSLLKLCGKPTADGQLLCKKCKHTCENVMDMISHKLDHKNKQFKCDQCDFVGNKVSALNRHKLSHSDGKLFACKKCSYVCKQLSEFRHHELTHKGPRSHKCDQCSFTCHLRGTLKKHAREEHGVIKMYHCDQCNYSGTRSSTLQRHTLVHQKEKPFACSECNYRCKLRNKLTTHMLTHRKRNCKCDECGYVAQHFGALKLHKRTHVKKGILFCDLCPYATPTLEYMEAHKNIHRGKRAYPCLECSYVSSHSSSFRRHLFTHSGEKPFMCSLCDFRACQENTLKIHMRTHSGERPYKCDLCDYASSTAGTLKRHKLVHSPIVW